MNDSPLVGILQDCSLHTLLLLTSKALARSGFGDVQLLDRRTTSQKSRYGGHELVCNTSIGMLPATVIVKVIKDDVRVRMTDEMAGAVVRRGADLGLIVTPHRVTAKALKQRSLYHRARVEIIDGPALASLLAKYRIGLRAKGDVDYAFFGSMEDLSASVIRFIERERV